MTKVDIISGFLGAGKTTFIKKLLKRVHSGSVKGRNRSHTDNKDLGIILKLDIENFFGNTEEKRSAYLVNSYVFGNEAEVYGIGVVFVVDILPSDNRGFVAHTLHKEDGGKHHSDLNCHDKIEDNG